ncbi:MAG: molybdenum cofactor guanylyltransferase, partial [Streptosporangiaceae bacterium]
MTAPVRAFDAVVLAGGRATRLGGADKPGLVVGQQTLLGSVVSAVVSAGAARVVVVGPRRPAALRPGTGGPGSGGPGTGGSRVRYAREDPPGCGPVAALGSGLAEVSAPSVVLAAADLPFLRPAHVTRLVAGLA